MDWVADVDAAGGGDKRTGGRIHAYIHTRGRTDPLFTTCERERRRERERAATLGTGWHWVAYSETIMDVFPILLYKCAV